MSRITSSTSAKDDYMSSGDRWLESVADELEAGARDKERRHKARQDLLDANIKRKHSSCSNEDYDDRRKRSTRIHYGPTKDTRSEYERSLHARPPSDSDAKSRYPNRNTGSWSKVTTRLPAPSRDEDEDDDDDDDDGEWVEAPAFSKLPTQYPSPSRSESTDAERNISSIPPPSRPRKGPTLPSAVDIQLMNSELHAESLEAMRSARMLAMRESEVHYTGAAENLLSGGANDPSGPRDTKIEKRRLENQTRREYIRAHSPGGVDEVGDDELFDGAVGGGPSNKISEIAARKVEKERIKKEKREAFYREKDAERRKRWEEMHAREEKTIDMLKELARQRFGDVP
ncbi:uncharacterized protein V1513DRAFT_449097 [Lipomyces chichibuensis]|uniref:uncharacterized protein n=1 Tax=Lipomyces chichibuensis TaxID=1546026 RepID=UPI00334369D5